MGKKVRKISFDGETILIRDFIEHADEYPVDRIYLVPPCPIGKSVFLVRITIEELKNSIYLDSVGRFFYDVEDDRCSLDLHISM